MSPRKGRKRSKFACLSYVNNQLAHYISHAQNARIEKLIKDQIHELASNFSSNLNAYNAMLVHCIEAVGQW